MNWHVELPKQRTIFYYLADQIIIRNRHSSKADTKLRTEAAKEVIIRMEIQKKFNCFPFDKHIHEL